MSEYIRVIGVAGRVAFSAARGGEKIALDRPMRVLRDEWINKRLDDGDIAIFADEPTKNQQRNNKTIEEKQEGAK